MLTRREFEVYMLICTQAMAAKDIAKQLGITPNTVNVLKRRILLKMNMANSLELLVQYHRKEL